MNSYVYWLITLKLLYEIPLNNYPFSFSEPVTDNYLLSNAQLFSFFSVFWKQR